MRFACDRTTLVEKLSILARGVSTRSALPVLSGILLQATSLNGPWTTNSATSPYTLTPTGAQKFYRVQLP